MQQYNCDIIILGGGLAGLTAAIDLSLKNYRVVVLEQKSYPLHKVCGEFVSCEVQPYLERLGAFPKNCNPPHIHHFLISDSSGQSLRLPLHMPAFGVSRYSWDAFMAQRAQQVGATLYTRQKVTEVSWLNHYFAVKTKTGEHYTAPVVLGSYGKRSNLHRQLSPTFAARRTEYLGVKRHYRASINPSEVQLHNFSGGYGGISQVENNTVNFCYLLRKSALQPYGSLAEFEDIGLTKNPFLKKFLKSAEPSWEKPLTISQINFAPKPCVENHVLMCGDAAGMIHPFCGNGMAMAVTAARLASQRVHEYLQGQRSRQMMEEQYRQDWRKIFAQRLHIGRSLSGLFGRERLSSAALKIGNVWPAPFQWALKNAHGATVH